MMPKPVLDLPGGYFGTRLLRAFAKWNENLPQSESTQMQFSPRSAEQPEQVVSSPPAAALLTSAAYFTPWELRPKHIKLIFTLT